MYYLVSLMAKILKNESYYICLHLSVRLCMSIYVCYRCVTFSKHIWLFLKDCLEGIKSQIKCFQLIFFVVFSFQDWTICDTVWGERAIAKIQFVVKFSRRGSISTSAPWYYCNLEQDLNFLNLCFLGRNEMTCVKHLVEGLMYSKCSINTFHHLCPSGFFSLPFPIPSIHPKVF